MKKQQRMGWFKIILDNPGEIFSTATLKEMFEISESTYIKDTWIYQHNFIENVDRNTWRIKRVF